MNQAINEIEKKFDENNYHKIERILNDFKNLKLTYSDAIGRIESLLLEQKSEMLKKLVELKDNSDWNAKQRFLYEEILSLIK
jgi:hypothetical protein